MVRQFCASLLEIKAWRALGIVGGCIILYVLIAVIQTQHDQEPIRWRTEEAALTGGAAPEAGALPVLLLMPAFASSQARSHYRHQLSSLLQHCRSPLSLQLVTPAQHTLQLAELLEELTEQLPRSSGCRLRYTLLRGADQLAALTDQRQRGRRLLAVLRQLAPLGRLVFLDEQTIPEADLGPLLTELAAFPEQQLAAGAPEDTARYLSRAQLEGEQLPEAGVSGRLLLLDLGRLAAEPELGEAAELPAADAGLQPDAGGPLTALRRRRPPLVGLLPCQWTVSRPAAVRPLDALFACGRPPLVTSWAGRTEADWEADVLRRRQERPREEARVS